MLSNLFLGVFDEFSEWIVRWPIILAIVLCVIAVSLAVLARRIARVIRKTNEIADNDKYYIAFKVTAVVLLFVALLIVIFV